jgi:toxin ParE1/3/4
VSQPKYDVRLLHIAENDLADIVAYVAVERPSAAVDQLARIEKALGLLKSNPFLGKRPSDEHLSELGYRCLIVDDSLAFHTVEEKIVFVHRILHGARDYLTLL